MNLKIRSFLIKSAIVFFSGTSLFFCLHFYGSINFKEIYEPRSLSYNELPSDIKFIIDRFADRGIALNKDIFRIEKIKYQIIDDYLYIVPFLGYCDKSQDLIILVKNRISNMERTLYHELGHCVLNFVHFHNIKDQGMIMFFTEQENEEQRVSDKDLDLFFNESLNKLRGSDNQEFADMVSSYIYLSMMKIKNSFR